MALIFLGIHAVPSQHYFNQVCVWQKAEGIKLVIIGAGRPRVEGSVAAQALSLGRWPRPIMSQDRRVPSKGLYLKGPGTSPGLRTRV